ncbi:MAG TPA: protein kinase [Polyangiaceae bacterium]|nr:protein kinase [Polyangiaceae bacterium]
MSHAAVPSVIGGRFRLEAEHRRGGMGSVWRAREIGSERPVAIKLLASFGDSQRARFERECVLLADLRHPRIVRYLAHGESDAGAPFLAMEWLEGETVADRLARERLTVGQTLALVESTSLGLDAAHARGVLHRDLKPSNLFLRQGRLDDVVLLDLGLARHVEDNDGLTRTGAVLGTASYMAPEQAQARGELTAAVDFFALGAILFECLTGSPPFVGAQLLAVLAKLLFEAPPRLRALRPELPEALEELIDALLEKDPARRLARSDELRRRLAALAAYAALGTPPSTPTPSASRPSDAEQELVSVILALPPADAPSLTQQSDATLFGERHERLADGTTIITLAQRGGAATDLAARAARCALRSSDARPGWSFVVATGRGMLSERTHIGEAVDRAATMLRARGGGAAAAIWLDEVTAGLLDARFRTRALHEGIVAFALEGEDASIDPERRLLGRPTPCVGREHELGILELTLAACVEEPGPRAVLVLGPPGSGKSRLRHELDRRARARGLPFQRWVGLADPIRTSATLGLIGSAVARACSIRAGAPAAENRQRLVERAGAVFVGGARPGLEFLALLAGMDADEGLPEVRRARQDPRLMSSGMARAWLDFLRAEAERQAVLLVLDDLQWADPLSLSLVERALRELPSSRLMVLGLGRPELNEIHPNLWGPALTRLSLRPLGAAATARLVRQMLGEGVSDDSVQRIVTRAAGNALYLEELIRAAHSRREAVPETVLAMLQARIGLLSPRARRVLRVASVFGETFPLGGAAALLGNDDASELEPLLSTLARDEVLELDETADQRWRFRHSLLRDAAYSLFTPDDRNAAHLSAARFLEAALDEPAVIAQHFERAGDLQSAVRHFTSAALRAYHTNDLGGAIALVKRGVDAGAAGPERGLLLSLSVPALFQSWRFAEAASATAEALALLPHGDPRRVLSIAWRAVAATQQGNWDDVERHMPEMLASTPAESDRVEFGTALSYAVIAYTGAGHREHCQHLVDRLQHLGPELGPDNPFAHGLACYARARHQRFFGDDPFLALELSEAAARSYEPTGHFLFPYMLVDAGECRRRLGDAAAAIALMREAASRAHVYRVPVTIAYVQQFLAGALAEHGSAEQVDEARELLDATFAMAGSGNVYHCLALIARAAWHLRRDEPERAEHDAQAAYTTLQGLRMRGYYPHALLPLLRAQTRRGTAHVEARAAETEALLADAAPAGILDLPLRLALAQAYRAVGREADARRVFADVRVGLERRASRAPDAASRAAFVQSFELGG